MDEFNRNHLRDLERRYSELINPKNIISMFDNETEFTEWAEMGTTEDVRAALIAFEKEELFDHCIILKRVLNTKDNG